ncbi:hypothetical protein CANARDRAFT_197082 [[Candida] arabinofermentans NRRL YB-2248]|uniref:CDC20/Fizzy WD40 domain-containing protein n=1 Tax=[Candida] arabinofermentans NRRL YB-2248 TaxID=983967 RepID=A0A1E4T3V9_9ASCO|nr:hypothetical protein CANARDRAFT_197082 [[Candida] arabinofermentans NRRL YB-2248]
MRKKSYISLKTHNSLHENYSIDEEANYESVDLDLGPRNKNGKFSLSRTFSESSADIHSHDSDNSRSISIDANASSIHSDIYEDLSNYWILKRLNCKIEFGRPKLGLNYYNWCIGSNCGIVEDENCFAGNGPVGCVNDPGTSGGNVVKEDNSDDLFSNNRFIKHKTERLTQNRGQPDDDIWVIGAGPIGLVDKVRLWSIDCGFKFHAESFNDNALMRTNHSSNASDPFANDDAEPNPFYTKDAPVQPDTYRGNVAKALGFKIRSRILNFKPLKFPTTRGKLDNILAHDEMKEKQEKLDFSIKSATSPTSTKRKIKTEVSFKVLDAPGLRNDFYANVVSYGKKHSIIAVGLGGIVYTWSNSTGTVPLQPVDNEIISCVSYSHDDILAVGTKRGRIIIYEYDSRFINTTAIMKSNTGVCCIVWIKGTNCFFAGDDFGDVTVYELVKDSNSDSFNLTIRCIFKCNEQQVCGIDISSDLKQITVGGNDNCCTIWDIADLDHPRLKFILPHQAAVKAIAYCPWMPNLLATGGGSKDRTIRFWHANSGTMINSIPTRAQITSLIWSKSSKEILVTFGFGEAVDKPTLIGIYSYPSMTLQTKLASTSNMRVLSAVLSNDYKSVCTAISDQSIRIYSIWESQLQLTNGEYDNDLFDSRLIDLVEGVDDSFSSIR